MDSGDRKGSSGEAAVRNNERREPKRILREREKEKREGVRECE